MCVDCIGLFSSMCLWMAGRRASLYLLVVCRGIDHMCDVLNRRVLLMGVGLSGSASALAVSD